MEKEASEDQHEDSESQSHDDGDEKPSKIGSISSLMGSFGNTLSGNLLAFLLCSVGKSIFSPLSDSLSSRVELPASENRKDRSLFLLSRNFIKLFLNSDVIHRTHRRKLGFRFL